MSPEYRDRFAQCKGTCYLRSCLGLAPTLALYVPAEPPDQIDEDAKETFQKRIKIKNGKCEGYDEGVLDGLATNSYLAL